MIPLLNTKLQVMKNKLVYIQPNTIKKSWSFVFFET